MKILRQKVPVSDYGCGHVGVVCEGVVYNLGNELTELEDVNELANEGHLSFEQMLSRVTKVELAPPT